MNEMFVCACVRVCNSNRRGVNTNQSRDKHAKAKGEGKERTLGVERVTYLAVLDAIPVRE